MEATGFNILLVENDPNDILFIQRAFRQADVTVTIQVVDDRDTVIDYLSGTGAYTDRDRYPLPRVILLDLKLSRRSGLEILEWIKQQPFIKRIPVIVLTSSKETIDIDQSYDLGVNSYLVKPVNFKALSEMIALLGTYWLRLNEHPSVIAAD
ncbi:MAG: response regulator [Leptolyngbyaceae cyanobacterium]